MHPLQMRYICKYNLKMKSKNILSSAYSTYGIRKEWRLCQEPRNDFTLPKSNFAQNDVEFHFSWGCLPGLDQIGVKLLA